MIEQNKGGYYLSLRRTQGTIRTDARDWNPWVEFFLQALQRQKQRLEKKMERERVMLGALPELSVAAEERRRRATEFKIAERQEVLLHTIDRLDREGDFRSAKLWRMELLKLPETVATEIP